MRHVIGYAVLLGLTALPATAQQLSDAEKKDGFESLFNGTDLSGWRFNSGGKGDNWEVKDGLLVLNGGSNHLASEKEYGDFVLRFEWRAEKKGFDSGFFVRSGKNVGANQIQMAQGGAGSFNLRGAKGVPNLHKPPGEWNSWEVTCVGEKIALVVNGEKAWEVTGLKPARGYLGIQAEGHHIDFRNFRLKEVK